MPSVVFLRGINAGGHRRFRPAAFARELGWQNVGAAGTFILPDRSKLAELPFAFAVCRASDLKRLAAAVRFPCQAGLVPFVSVLTAPAQRRPPLPLNIPGEGEWFVQVQGRSGPFLYGQYRRHMRTIGHLAALDRLFGVPVTTRGWSTIEKVLAKL